MLKSASGIAWERARNYAEDHLGNRINHGAEYEGIKCKTCHAYAPAPASDSHESLDERLEREGRFERLIAGLTKEEHRFLVAQQKLLERVARFVHVTEGQRQDYLNDGYTFIPKSAQWVERGGQAPVEVVEVARYELTQTSKLSYEDIAAEWGCSANKVREVGRSAHRKMREATRR